MAKFSFSTSFRMDIAKEDQLPSTNLPPDKIEGKKALDESCTMPVTSNSSSMGLSHTQNASWKKTLLVALAILATASLSICFFLAGSAERQEIVEGLMKFLMWVFEHLLG